MKVLSALLLFLLLPCIVDGYSLFDFNNKSKQQPSDSNEIIQPKQKQQQQHDNKNNDNAGRHHNSNYNNNLRIIPPTESSTISTGLFHTCAIVDRHYVDEDICGKNKVCGPLKCWGHDEKGQSTPPPGVFFTEVSSGGFFTCGLLLDGKVSCFGDIDHPPTSLELLSREEVYNVKHARRMQQEENGWKGGGVQANLGDGHYIQVSSGHKHACAISKGHEVRCWGRNDFGEANPPNGKFVQISAGNSFTCGVQSNGEAKCWGKNVTGQSSPPSYPQNIFEQVSASMGGDHACGVLKDDGNIKCWGNNGRGQSEDQNGTFLRVSTGTRTSCAIRVVSSDRHSSNSTSPAAISNDYDESMSSSSSTSIHCWGNRANALLDHFEQQHTTMNLSHEHDQIALGQDHACVTSKMMNNADNTLDSEQEQTSLECWWMGGSNFDAHSIPVGISIV